MTLTATRLPAMVWLGLALSSGLLLAMLPLPAALLLLGVALLALCALLSPLAALSVVLIAAPLRTLIATESSWPLPLDIGQLAMLIFAAVWFMHYWALHRHATPLTWSPISVAIILVLASTALSAFAALSIGAWLREWLKWLQMLFMVMVAATMVSGRRWRWLIFALAVAGLANALIGVYQFFGGSGADHLLINDRFYRAFGTFGQPNPFGGFLGLLVPIVAMAALGYALSWWRRRQQADITWALFYALCAGFMLLGILMSWSRGAWLALAASVTVIILALPRRIWQGIGLTLGFAVFVVLLWSLGLLPASVTARIATSTQDYFTYQDMRGIDITPENYAVTERLAHWQAALNMARSQPWFGVGLGNYEVVYSAYDLINWPEALGHAHNYYLNLLAEAGIVGLLGYGKAWVLIIWTTWRVRRHPDQFIRLIAIGILGSWTYLTVHSLFDNLFVNNIFIHIGLILGLLAVLYNQFCQTRRLRFP